MGAKHFGSAGLILIRNREGLETLYVVYRSFRRYFKTRVCSAGVEPNFNAVVECMDKPDGDSWTARYTPKTIVTSYMKINESSVKCAKRWAAFGVWVPLVCAMMALRIAGREQFYLPVTDGRYILTGCDCLDLTGQNVFEAWEGLITGFLSLVSGSEKICLLFYPPSPT